MICLLSARCWKIAAKNSYGILSLNAFYIKVTTQRVGDDNPGIICKPGMAFHHHE